jgi:phosphoribosylaminoimidazole-succinocarboxamide synthase
MTHPPQGEAISNLELPGIPKVNQGKVREIFGLEDHLLIVATDRVSAFDVILPNAIPHKGRVLTQLSAYWFLRLHSIVENHLISIETDEFPASLEPFRESLQGRSMLVRKCEPLPIECVVRGYLAGSGWKEYRQSETICGIKLPGGLQESAELPEPIFTPSTKATSGHDENISFEEAVELVGSDIAHRVREFSIEIYNQARAYALERGIIICDTKFEFGLQGSDLLLIDEVLTPDSSRFWPADQYQPGQPQPSFDKQFVRDYLETLDWDKKPPGPTLPDDVVEATSRRYLEAYALLTGTQLEGV